MAKLKCFSMSGVDLWFYPNDHAPPHFHAKRKGEWELRVKFLEERETMFEMKWRKSKKASISAQDKERLVKMVESHRLEILKEWEQKVNQT
jgi:hypothetical protein